MSPGEITAIVSVAVAIFLHVVASLRFLYRMEARVDGVAKGLTRVEGELHELGEKIEKVTTRAETILVIQESVRQLADRVQRIENRGARG